MAPQASQRRRRTGVPHGLAAAPAPAADSVWSPTGRTRTNAGHLTGRWRGLTRLGDQELLMHAVGIVVAQVADQLIAPRCQGQGGPAHRAGADPLTRAWHRNWKTPRPGCPLRRPVMHLILVTATLDAQGTRTIKARTFACSPVVTSDGPRGRHPLLADHLARRPGAGTGLRQPSHPGITKQRRAGFPGCGRSAISPGVDRTGGARSGQRCPRRASQLQTLATSRSGRSRRCLLLATGEVGMTADLPFVHVRSASPTPQIRTFQRSLAAATPPV